MRTFVYPGSFDPVTNGHLDIINRASKICDKLIVLVSVNTSKTPAFTIEERLNLLKLSLGERDNIEITSFSGLLVEFMRKANAKTIIKGLRAVSDFEYEMQMALLNHHMDNDIDTLFMMTSIQNSFLSSSAIKAVAVNGGKINDFVPEQIADIIIRKLKK
ncbi:MAG: pantetheine-phosphate adenylyltransferase [Acetivibrionales bacterium]|nr:pantetheine-phosphate adenylyltransferase [Clostridiaceae bacterium]